MIEISFKEDIQILKGPLTTLYEYKNSIIEAGSFSLNIKCITFF